MARQTLEQWLHEVLNDTNKEECTRLALIHRVGMRPQEVYSMSLKGRSWNVRDLARLLKGRAEGYAQDLPGMQTFNLLAFYGEDSEPGAIRPFTEQGSAENEGLMTEPPTKDGFMQQMMRHNEAMVSANLRSQQLMYETLGRTVESLRTENAALRRENLECFEAIRDAGLAMADQNHEREMKRLAFERSTEERRKWLSFGPALINSLLNKEVFPQSVADSALIDSIAESLTEDDIQKLAATGVIKPEIWGPLSKRMADALAKKNRAREDVLAITNGLDPESDVMGGGNDVH